MGKTTVGSARSRVALEDPLEQVEYQGWTLVDGSKTNGFDVDRGVKRGWCEVEVVGWRMSGGCAEQQTLEADFHFGALAGLRLAVLSE